VVLRARGTEAAMMRASNPHCERLIGIACLLVERLPDTDIVAAFLFGSAAWGDADAASDLDVMLLLDRSAGYREVSRVRVADVLGGHFPDGPAFADLDRISAETFAGITAKGGWGHRVAHSVILKDTDGFYESIRNRMHTEYLSPEARGARFLQRRKRVEEHLAAAREALSSADRDLAAMHARLAVEAAGAALIEISDDRLSVTHYVESTRRALSVLGQADLFEPFLGLLSLDAPLEHAERSRVAYDTFAEALRRWMAQPEVSGRLSLEDLAWAEFTYGTQTYEEIEHKTEAFRQLGRIPALLYYLDGLLMVPIRMNVGKIFALRSTGTATRISIPEVQIALKAEPNLYAEWVLALRLNAIVDRFGEADDVTRALLAAGDAALVS
jgi:hypothetical protein